MKDHNAKLDIILSFIKKEKKIRFDDLYLNYKKELESLTIDEGNLRHCLKQMIDDKLVFEYNEEHQLTPQGVEFEGYSNKFEKSNRKERKNRTLDLTLRTIPIVISIVLLCTTIYFNYTNNEKTKMIETKDKIIKLQNYKIDSLMKIVFEPKNDTLSQ